MCRIDDRNAGEAVIRVRRLRGAVERDGEVPQYIAADAEDARNGCRYVGELAVEHEPLARKTNELDFNLMSPSINRNTSLKRGVT